MNNIRSRKYARTSKKRIPMLEEDDEPEISFSPSAALGILGGTFLVGLISGKLLCMCAKRLVGKTFLR